MRNRILFGVAVLIIAVIGYKIYSGLEQKKDAEKIAKLNKQREDSLLAVQALKQHQEYQKKQGQETRKIDSLNSIRFAKQEEELAKQRASERQFQEIEQKIEYLLQVDWRFSEDGFIQKVDDGEIEFRFNIRDVNIIHKNGNIYFSCSDNESCIVTDDNRRGNLTHFISEPCGKVAFEAIKKEVQKYRSIIKPL
jgi:hypothetical protein